MSDLLRFKQIIAAAPGWRVLFCGVDQYGAHFTTHEMIGWGLTDDNSTISEIYPLVWVGSVQAVNVRVYTEGGVGVRYHVLEPSDDITVELKEALEDEIRDAMEEQQVGGRDERP